MEVVEASRTAVNPDLDEERRKCTFPVIELTNLLDGGPTGTEERHKIEEKFARDPKFPRYVDFSHLSTDEYYSKAIETTAYMHRKLEEWDLIIQIPGDLQFVRSAHISSIAIPCGDPLIVHPFMFIPSIMSQGTEEQQAKWIPLARKHTIIGTYCQTELGHGTNMKGLETTATYDPETDEFVLHSPTISSIKFWPGGMGRSCNSAVIVAQLYTQGTCHGVHPFFLQLRSLEDHQPLPGITIGEVGPKLGLNANDNGFLKLDHVRIPRKNMLMKHNKVLRDGTYVRSKKPRASYGTLIMARTAISLEVTLRLAQAAVIAVRYSAVRRQGGSFGPGEAETKILDYQTQQYKLFPQVAMAYAGFFAFRLCYNKMMEFLANPTTLVAAETHAMSSSVKAMCTQNAANGVELCRLACGGLGYLQASRFPNLYGFCTAACTYDGENTVLLLETARYLIKSYHAAKNGEQVGSSVEYLNLCRMDKSNLPISADDKLEVLQDVFQKTTAIVISQVATRLVVENAVKGRGARDSWNSQTVDLVKGARLHGQGFFLHAVRKMLATETDMSDSLKTVLRRLFELMALYWIRESAGDFIQYGGVSSFEMAGFNVRLFALLDELRPDIVGLVDAFDFRDESLQSVIGCYDGRVYEHVYDYLMKLPTNQNKVHPAYDKFLRHTNQSKL